MADCYYFAAYDLEKESIIIYNLFIKSSESCNVAYYSNLRRKTKNEVLNTLSFFRERETIGEVWALFLFLFSFIFKSTKYSNKNKKNIK